jgi:site-specific DNA-methyltransferase (adenine-specific)
VSRNQIIWGGNYFSLPPTRCFLVWRKLTIAETFTMAMCEYAWTSFNANAKLFECAPQGNAREKRFHPTQKPVKLYTWCLGLFAKPGDRLLDTHGGSMSSAVAAWQLGFDMDICEINEFYLNEGKRRVEREMRQPTLNFQDPPSDD